MIVSHENVLADMKQPKLYFYSVPKIYLYSIIFDFVKKKFVFVNWCNHNLHNPLNIFLKTLQ